MKTTRQSDLKLPIITYLICVIHVNGATLNIAASHQYPIVSTNASLTCHIPSFIGVAEWIKSTSTLAQCIGGSCFPLGSVDPRYQYSANTTAMTVTISSLDIALDEATWSCTYDATDTGAYNLTVFDPPETSNLTIIGPVNMTVYDDVTVYLSVSTGCIHPIDAAHYIVEWKYVDAASAAENAFETIIAKNFTSGGSCSKTYERNLTFNLYLTNKMNTDNTSLYISQIKMTFTMAGIIFPASLNVAYNVTPNGTASPKLSTDPPKNETNCELELGLGLGLGFGIPCVITGIEIGIFIYTSYEYAYNLGFVNGLGLGITFQVGWIIIVSIISKGTTSCKLELGLGLGLGSGMPCVITSILAMIFAFFPFSLFEDIPNRVELGKGKLTGLLSASVIGIIVVYLIYKKLKPEPRSIEPDNKPRELAGKKPEEVRLEPTVKKSKTKNSGPPAVHTGTQNKVEPNTNSKKTNDRQQSVPPANTGIEDTPTFRRLPQPPQNGEIKDRSLRGISATIDDTPDLASETPRPNRLRPLTPKQATVQKEDASEEPKKKRKKKKKKDQMNVETPEEENGETDLRDN